MPPRSSSITGRYDEILAELTEAVAAAKTPTASGRLKKQGLAMLEAIGDVATKRDTVHLSLNSSDTAQGTTYTVTLTHTPAPKVEADEAD